MDVPLVDRHVLHSELPISGCAHGSWSAGFSMTFGDHDRICNSRLVGAVGVGRAGVSGRREDEPRASPSVHGGHTGAQIA